MAKDGTNRGGRRVRAGDKPLSAVEKIQKGQSVKIMDNDLPTLTPPELDSVDLPPAERKPTSGSSRNPKRTVNLPKSLRTLKPLWNQCRTRY